MLHTLNFRCACLLSFVFVLEKGAVAVQDKRKVYYINSTQRTTLDTHSVPLATGEFKGEHLPPWMWGASSRHQASEAATEAASKAFWVFWQLQQTLGQSEWGDRVPFPDLQWVSSFLMPLSAGQPSREVQNHVPCFCPWTGSMLLLCPLLEYNPS